MGDTVSITHHRADAQSYLLHFIQHIHPFDGCTNFSSFSNFIEKDFLDSVEQFFNKKNITKFRKQYCFTIIVTTLNDRNRASYVDIKQFPFKLQNISKSILLTGYCTLKLFYTYILYKRGLTIKY